MRFISPKTDFAFRKIFGNEQHKDILISFLDSLLYSAQGNIKDLEILNPYQAPRIRGVKATYLDVKARLDNGTTVIIEMQVLNIEGFEKRILYNAAKAYSIQLKSGEPYPQLSPIIALTLTDFVMFPDHAPYISRFLLKEKEFLFDYPQNDLQLVFVELPKFQTELDALTSLSEKWLYFIQHALDLQTVPEPLGQVPEIQQAFEVANQSNLTSEELDELEHQVIFIQDQRGAITKATQDTQRDIAQRSLPILDDRTISQITGLSLEQVQHLRQETDT